MRALVATTEELIGGINAVVTAAGVLKEAAVPVEQIKPADWTQHPGSERLRLLLLDLGKPPAMQVVMS